MQCSTLFALLLATFALCTAQNAKTTAKSGVSCFQCNSLTTGQEKCESSEEKDLAKFKKTCPKVTDGDLAGTEANSCRKVLQTVSGEQAIIRECAYTGEEEVDGKRRIGNKGIVLYLYQCFNEEAGKPCNSAAGFGFGSILVVSALYNLLF